VALLSGPVRADEPQAVKLTPQVQALLQQLLKAAEMEVAEDATTTTTDPAARPSPEGGAPASRKKEPSTGLQTGNLRTGSLSGTPRMTEEQWRQLFPARR
jgi:hypothetical protein